MFPAVKLPTFEETTRPSLLENSDVNKSISNLGYFYSIGLFNQMLELHKLSSTIFLELEKDFNKLNARMEKMQQNLASFKQRAAQVIQRNAQLTPEQMAQKQCQINEVPDDISNTDANLAEADTYVKDLIAEAEKANPPPTLKAWSSIIPNYQELDKQISDPTQFERQYKQELVEQLAKAIQQQERRRKKKHVAVDEGKSDQKSSTMLHAYTETVAPPSITLLTPPPVGQTSDWRNRAFQEMQAAQSSAASRMSAPPPTATAAPTFKAPTLASISAPLHQPAQHAQAPSAHAPAAPPPPGVPAPPPPPGIPAPPPPPGIPAPPPPPGIPPPPANLPPPPPPPPGGDGAPRQIAPKPSAPKPAPPPPAQVSHIDLIKAGGFKLRPVNRQEKPKAPVKQEERDPNSLSIGELLEKVASIRQDTQASDYEEEEDSKSSEDW